MRRQDRQTVKYIRAVCARELGLPKSHRFFRANYEPGESPNKALLRIFNQERPHHDNDTYTILVLVYG